eukprot:4413668-Prymnesium_polylepis.1
MLISASRDTNHVNLPHTEGFLDHCAADMRAHIGEVPAGQFIVFVGHGSGGRGNPGGGFSFEFWKRRMMQSDIGYTEAQLRDLPWPPEDANATDTDEVILRAACFFFSGGTPAFLMQGLEAYPGVKRRITSGRAKLVGVSAGTI